MNEKFLSRGKREDNGEWVEGSLVFTNIIIPNTIDNMFFHYINAKDSMTLGTGKYLTKDSMLKFYIVTPETVGRYTGKNDKKGRNVFEGDIVRVKKFNDDPIIGKVVFNENTAGFEVWWDIVVGAYGEKATRKENFAVCGQMEVIGNIHDNPELIGGNANET